MSESVEKPPSGVASASSASVPSQSASSADPECPSNAAASTAPQIDWVCVGHVSRFGPRTDIKVHKRRVTVLRLKDRRSQQPKWSCIDTICYHAGGPLTEGTLHDVDGRTCLKCPWHSYLVDIDSGEGLYMNLNRKYQSKGLRQRVHDVERRHNHVWIKLRLEEKEVPSDDYAYGPRFAGREEKVEVPSFPE